ncbi:MAG: type II secretion system GspH family protein [Phycisphaerales bacterium]|nr:type II secretion system GspH family protein [Phycisphaerales bacterium]
MPQRRAFTLIEVILVTVMMALLATVVLVRFSGTEGRRFELAVEEIGDLLLMYAVRSEFAEDPVGISSNPDRNSLRLMLRRRTDETAPAEWVPDLSVQEVRLPASVDVSALEFVLDGDQMDPSDRPLTSIPGQPRPLMQVTVRSTDTRLPQEVVLTLAPTAWRPTISGGSGGLLRNDTVRATEDLDNTGRWQEDW